MDEQKCLYSYKQEVLDDEHLMETIEEDKYLGDIIMNNGKNTKNIKARKDKGEGIRKQIIAMLEDVCFGPFEFEVADIWRNSLFINSILTNSETWYNLSKTEVDQLEQIDEQLLRDILETGRSTPKVMLYLEMGCLPIRFILMKRRIYLSSLHSSSGQRFSPIQVLQGPKIKPCSR